jgi:hypothetical protein
MESLLLQALVLVLLSEGVDAADGPAVGADVGDGVGADVGIIGVAVGAALGRR